MNPALCLSKNMNKEQGNCTFYVPGICQQNTQSPRVSYYK